MGKRVSPFSVVATEDGLFFGSKRRNKMVFAFTIFLINLLFIHSYAPAGECSPKSISMESVLQKLKEKEDLILIDVRHAHEFEKFRIPGSINIPLFALKTKTFLKSRPLVLINEGHGYKELMDVSANLAGSGFSISILDGGLCEWERKGGPLEGDVFARRELNRISPRVFSAGCENENWILVDVSKRPSAETDYGALRPLHIPFTTGREGFIPALEFSVRNHKDREFASVVICDKDGKSYEEIERQIRPAGIRNVLYLEGGAEGYKVFKAQQISMSQKKQVLRTGKETNTSRNCPSCP